MKKVLRKTLRKQRMTVSAYALCVCGCTVNCNPCGTVPTTAYIAQLDRRLLTQHNSNMQVSQNIINT
ncbi:MAG: hypothetical protein LBD23_02470 [Oscillospiraceae bacterium]|jgi:hypothetical protein|nr:hypothetical protein [Oscillospiraceae bacterium]